MRFGSQPDWLLPVVHCLMALRRDGAERRCYLPCTAQLAIVIRNIPALLIVPQRGIFHFAIFLLATGLERIATYLNVGTGLAVRAAGAVVVSVPIISVPVISVLIAIMIAVASICIAIVAIATVAVVTIVPVISVVAVAIIPAGATEVSIQVLDFSVATLVVRKLSAPPVAAFVLTGGIKA